MFSSPFEFLMEQVSTPEELQTLDVLDSCYIALSEGVNDSFVVDTTVSSTYKLLQEMLDKIYSILLDIYSRLLNYLNNYFMNSARMIDKYRNIIIARYDKLKSPLLFMTHQYPNLYESNYPNIVHTNKISDMVESFQQRIVDNFTLPEDVSESVDVYINNFAVDTIGSKVDIDNLKADVERIVRKRVQGMEVLKKLSQSDLNKFIDEIVKYKDMKSSITKIKKDIIAEYQALRRSMQNQIRDKVRSTTGINDIANPDAAALKNAEYNRFASINVQVMRMYTAFINIYNVAFNTKLKCFAEKIDENKAIINELLTKTSVFAAANPNTPRAYRAPQKFDPKIS